MRKPASSATGRASLPAKVNVFRCPFCPFKTFSGGKHARRNCSQHARLHHVLEAVITTRGKRLGFGMFVASGNKQKHVIKTLYNLDALMLVERSDYLQRSVAIMRSRVGSAPNTQQSSLVRWVCANPCVFVAIKMWRVTYLFVSGPVFVSSPAFEITIRLTLKDAHFSCRLMLISIRTRIRTWYTSFRNNTF